MYTIATITPPASEPVTTASLKLYLHLNTSYEDTLLGDCITTARQMFEHHTQRQCVTATLRQYVQHIAHTHRHFDHVAEFQGNIAGNVYPSIYLMRGDVQSVSSVHYYDPSGNLQADTTYSTDLIGNPSRVYWPAGLPSITTALPHVAYCDFVAGWTSVPVDVCTAIRLLAAHYFDQRSAYTTDNLKELPQGFAVVCAKYTLALSGTWNQ